MPRPEFEEKLHDAMLTLDGARSENNIGLCKRYIAVLTECRGELYRLPDVLNLTPRSSSSSSWEHIGAPRKAAKE